MNVCAIEKIDVVIDNDNLEKVKSYKRTPFSTTGISTSEELKRHYIDVPMTRGTVFYIDVKFTNYTSNYMKLHYIKDGVEHLDNDTRIRSGLNVVTAPYDADKLMYTSKGEWFSGTGAIEGAVYSEQIQSTMEI